MRPSIALAVTSLFLASVAYQVSAGEPGRISAPGYYGGYAPVAYDGYDRTSFYVTYEAGG